MYRCVRVCVCLPIQSRIHTWVYVWVHMNVCVCRVFSSLVPRPGTLMFSTHACMRWKVPHMVKRGNLCLKKFVHYMLYILYVHIIIIMYSGSPCMHILWLESHAVSTCLPLYMLHRPHTAYHVYKGSSSFQIIYNSWYSLCMMCIMWHCVYTVGTCYAHCILNATVSTYTWVSGHAMYIVS